MKILATGNYDPNYNRTRILLRGLQNNHQIQLTEHPITSLKKFDKPQLKKQCDEADFIYLPPFTHESVKHIKKLTNTPIVFDPLISKYLTKVFDYQQVSKYSPRAYKNYLKDKIPMQQCDLLIADTFEHKKYFVEKFNLNANKIVVLPIGANTSDFSPSTKKENNTFEVGFYGGFIPLQGVSYIVEAAHLLQNEKDIHFNLIGTGFELEKIKLLVQKKKLKNITFLGWIEYDDLPSKINEFDICLGIFGDTPKTDLVIPNKIYHYAALQKCTLTKETPAIKEVFSDNINITLTNNNPKAIAEKILFLKTNKPLTAKLASAAHNLIQQEYNENKIANRFLEFLEKFK